jgi:hypothetical protein
VEEKMADYLYKKQYEKMVSGIIWTHKIQCCYLEHITIVNKWLKVIKYFFAALMSISTVMTAVFEYKTATIILGFVTVIALFVNLLLDNIVSDEDIKDLVSCTSSLCKLRDKVLLTMEEIETGKISEDVSKQYFIFYDEQYQELCSKLPSVSDKYVSIAEKKLKVRKDEEPNKEFFDDTHESK